MRANGRVSGAEARFRRALWAEGARGFRRGETLLGRPDIVFPAIRLAVFVHGCFWHRCATCAPRDVKANAEFWRAKFEANVARDRAARSALQASGWDVTTVWEHDIRADIRAAARRLTLDVASRRAAV